MKLGIISDIHDDIKNLKKAINIFSIEKVSLVCFCGDLVSPNTLEAFKSFQVPVKAVFGNMDKSRQAILNKIQELDLNLEYPPGENLAWKFNFKGRRIAFFHGHYQDMVKTLVEPGIYDFVFTGHTHQEKIEKIGNTLWVNPGAVCGWSGLNKSREKSTIAIADIKTKKAEIKSL